LKEIIFSEKLYYKKLIKKKIYLCWWKMLRYKAKVFISGFFKKLVIRQTANTDANPVRNINLIRKWSK